MKSYLCSVTTILIAFFLVSIKTATAQVQLTETTLDTVTLISGLDIPWEIRWGPDNKIWTTERFGRISRIDPETGEQDVVLDLSGTVYQSGESGMLGMVLHPDFDNQPFVYFAYTYKPGSQIFEKIVRYTYQDGMLSDEFVLLDNIPGNTTHDGCRMIILPDNTLLFSTGDAQNQPAAQDTASLNGKFLRLNLDGSIPSDNPYPGNPVYSFGHRNPQGLLLAPNGIIYSSEHGPSNDDEFNIIMPGRNYGWPNVEGFCDKPEEISFCEANNVVEPLAAWTPTIATSDIVYYDHSSIPEWEDHILLTTLKNKRLYVLTLSDDGSQVTGEEQLFNDYWGRLRDILQGPNGEIYLATSGSNWANTEPFTHKIIKIWNPEYVSVSEQGTPSFKIQISPNPARESTNLTIQKELLGSLLQVYTSNGKLVYQKILDSTLQTIPTRNFQPGIFFITVSSAGTVLFSTKLMVN